MATFSPTGTPLSDQLCRQGGLEKRLVVLSLRLQLDFVRSPHSRIACVVIAVRICQMHTGVPSMTCISI